MSRYGGWTTPGWEHVRPSELRNYDTRRHLGLHTPTEVADDLQLPRAIVLGWIANEEIPTVEIKGRVFLTEQTRAMLVDRAFEPEW